MSIKTALLDIRRYVLLIRSPKRFFKDMPSTRACIIATLPFAFWLITELIYDSNIPNNAWYIIPIKGITAYLISLFLFVLSTALIYALTFKFTKALTFKQIFNVVCYPSIILVVFTVIYNKIWLGTAVTIFTTMPENLQPIIAKLSDSLFYGLKMSYFLAVAFGLYVCITSHKEEKENDLQKKK